MKLGIKLLTVTAGLLVAVTTAALLPPSPANGTLATSHKHRSAADNENECPLSKMPTNIPGVGPITGVPEFHDCQRFALWKDTAWVYDSVYAIFATLELYRLQDGLARLDSSRQGAAQKLRDSVSLQRTAGAGSWPLIRSSLLRAAQPRGLVAAVIYSWAGTYSSLGINPGFNCLYLYDSGDLKARIVSYGWDQPECNREILTGPPPDLPTTDLLVHRVPAGDLGVNAVPPVARWEWNAKDSTYHIGIKCGPAWCQIGPSGFTPATPYPSGEAQVEAKRVSQVAGWYDEQRLAEMHGGVTKPGQSLGVAFPAPNLDQLTLDDFGQGRWVRTAYISIPERNPAYAEKLHLAAAVARPRVRLTRLNLIEVCRGSRSSCRIPEGLVCEWATGAEISWDELWWARITPPGGRPKYRCNLREDHSDLRDDSGNPIHIPGTVRWRWQANDETVWMRCAQGCCEVQ